MPAGEPIDQTDVEPAADTLSRRGVIRRGLGFAFAAPALLTLLQACGGDDDEDDAASTPTPAAATGSGTETEDPDDAAETPTPTAAGGAATDLEATVTVGGGGDVPTSEALPEPPSLP